MEAGEEIGSVADGGAGSDPLPPSEPAGGVPEPSAGDEKHGPGGAPRSGPSSPAAEPPKLIRVSLDSLKPNPSNAKIYRESLRKRALGPLVRDLAANGQHEPIIVNPQNVILDGHRRCCALRLAGATHALVIVDYTHRSPEEEKDYILDSYTLKRRASLAERVNLFEELVESYTRRHGRPRGRPKKGARTLSDYWSTNRIRDEAARGAGFGSRETARQAAAVMRSSDENLKKRLASDEVSIDAAYHLLSPKAAQYNVQSPATARGSAEQEPPSTSAATQSGEGSALPRSDVNSAGSKGKPRRRLEPTPPARSSGSQRHDPRSSTPANELDSEAVLDAFDLHELLFAVRRKIDAAADSGSPDYFHQCVESAQSMFNEAVAEAAARREMSKSRKRARNVA